MVPVVFWQESIQRCIPFKEYNRIFEWYEKNAIPKKFPLFGKETKGDSFFTKLTVNVFLVVDKLKLVNVFAKLYCSEK